MIKQSVFRKECWHRFEFEQMPIYIRPEGPDWFIPNSRGDHIIQRLDSAAPAALDPDTLCFLQRLPGGEPTAYKGRAEYLQLDRLGELWFHVTNRCNLSCSHCLFASSPKDADTLSSRRILTISKEAHRLGTRLFALTGGEPFVHPEIEAIIGGLLNLEDSHVVVLTNGMNLQQALIPSHFDPERLHLQISVDGTAAAHERIRGKGTHAQLERNLAWLKRQKMPYTLSMCTNEINVGDMPAMVDFAAENGAANIHFMWYFIRGRAEKDRLVPVEILFENLMKAAARAEARPIAIDNIESMKTQVFAPRGTKHDGAGAAWESLAVGPDGRLYPSAALVGVAELASDMSGGLETAWRESPVLNAIRKTTAVALASPFRFLTGGGDLDHSYSHQRTFTGDDPYHPLYEKAALWLMTREARCQPDHPAPQMRLCMGEILESCGGHGSVSLTHSNCLLATVHENSLSVVKSFYASAAGDKKADILNPVCYEEALITHIPKAYRFRGYGCGSPVLDADIQNGERVVDLGCGSGVECFIAARLAGKNSRVTGVDMLEPMLSLADEGSKGVVENLGYNNLRFQKGYLEALPLKDESADVMLSNCVMNLSVHKRKAYAEIFRVLNPGGRLVISDIVCETEPDAAIRNDETLRGECIAGAMAQHQLVRLLEETGFQGIRLIKRFPYRSVQGHPFFSLTFSAVKPKASDPVRVVYRGPLTHLTTHNGALLIAGAVRHIPRDEAEWLGDQVFILDESGTVTNIHAENACACFTPPEEKKKTLSAPGLIALFPKRPSGCMVCGAPITYFPVAKPCRCAYCRNEFNANAQCEKGHYVCDACHVEDGLKVIQHLCTTTTETDMIRLFVQIRKHPAIPVNGPEYHAMVPGVILATYRNLGGQISQSIVETGITRGTSVAGGYCGFMGVCGAAVGVGIAFSLILEATPLTPEKRRDVQQVTKSVLGTIADLKAARCCQRDAWLALTNAAELSKRYLPVPLAADERMKCTQQAQNKECIGRDCPLLRSSGGRNKTVFKIL